MQFNLLSGLGIGLQTHRDVHSPGYSRLRRNQLLEKNVETLVGVISFKRHHFFVTRLEAAKGMIVSESRNREFVTY